MTASKVGDDSERELRRLRREVKRLTYDVKNAAKQAPVLRAMVEGAPDAITIVDGSGVIVEHNSALNRLLNQTGILAGQRSQTLFHTRASYSDTDSPQPLLSEATLHAARSSPQRMYGYCGDASIEIHLSTFQLGERLLFVCVVRALDDATKQARELHAARVRVTELNQELHQARDIERQVRHESLALLAGTLAHDLNNALAIVSGNIDILKEDIEETDHVEILEDMAHACRDVASLARRLKTFSSGPSLLLSPLELNGWVPEFISGLGKSMGAKVRFDDLNQPCWIAADQAQIGQVMLNLVTNAVQAGAKNVSISIREERVGRLKGKAGQRLKNPDRPHCHVSVADDGNGISDDIVSSVFEPFYSTRQTGSGLGLASVCGIMAAHEGGVCIESALHRGTTLTLVFPLAQDMGELHSDRRDEQQTLTDLSDQTVLVLEDDHRVRQVIRRHLETAGAQVHAVSTAEEAIAQYGALRHGNLAPTCVFDLLIEGGMGGVEALSILQSTWHDIDAIACSGHADVDISQAYRALGFRAYLAKPFTRNALLKAVADAPPSDRVNRP